jgi:hypothetical protein
MHKEQTTPALYFRLKVKEGHRWSNATYRAQISGDTFNEPIITELIRDGYAIPLIQQLIKKDNYNHERIQAIKAKVEAEKAKSEEAGNG